MAKDEPSDPKIVDRLSKLPPFKDEEPQEEAPAAQNEQENEQESEQKAPEAPSEVLGELAEETKDEKEEEGEETDEQKKRTAEQFEKLKAHNAQLKEELEKTKKVIPTKNALEALIPDFPEPIEPPTTNVIPQATQYPGLTNKDIKDTFANLTDDQGYVDTGLLKETLTELQRRAKEAEERAAIAERENKRNTRRMDDFERKELMRKVHEAYPRLNPENANATDPNVRFDDAFYEAFQGEVIRQWSTIGKEDVWVAAKKWSDILHGVKKADKEKAEAAELAKKNINATTVRPTSQRENPTDVDELIRGTRMGVKGALAERLKRAGQ